MTTLASLVAASLATGTPALQAGLGGDPVGQLLIALVAIALLVVVGKFVLALAWRLITIGIVVVAVLYLLSVVGIF
ncbi:hypothetical protein [Halorubrum gandharaense]